MAEFIHNHFELNEEKGNAIEVINYKLQEAAKVIPVTNRRNLKPYCFVKLSTLKKNKVHLSNVWKASGSP